MTPSASSPGMPSLPPLCRPAARKNALYPWERSSSRVTSVPTSTPHRISTPIFSMISISPSMTFFSRRKFGMPFIIMPPGRCSRSNTVTG